jgi:hypothetical protein
MNPYASTAHTDRQSAHCFPPGDILPCGANQPSLKGPPSVFSMPQRRNWLGVAYRCENDSMNEPEVIVGFPEMWQPVYTKYRLFFECATKLAPIVSEMVKTPVGGQLLLIVGRMVAAAANSYGALLTLVLNGYGQDAMKIARSIYETELNILWLKKYPEDLRDFLDYHLIQQKQLYEQMNEEQRNAVPKERYDQMMADYNRVLPRFASGRDKTRPRNEWCRESIYDRATEAEQYWKEQMAADNVKDNGISLYKTFYRQASSMHHMDIAGVIASLDQDMNAIMAPSWEHLDDALVAASSVLRCVSYYDEMAQLGLKERVDNGPNEDYIAACKSLQYTG